MTRIQRPTEPLTVHSAILAEHMTAHGQSVQLAKQLRPQPASDLEYPPHGPLYGHA